MPAEGQPGRLEDYEHFSKTLARLTDEQLSALIGERPQPRGWGLSRSIEFEGRQIFAKRVPVTDRELAHAYSTRNLYGLPAYYSYGVGSAGFGVFREIAAHTATTTYVLEGRHPRFPLMYHHRLLALESEWGGMEADRHRGYVRHWNYSEAVDHYMRDRATARREAVVLLEHFPNTISPWLLDNQHAARDVVQQVLDTISFLRGEGIVHFDAHFANVVTDGESHFLTDYGLLLDPRFELTAEERAFLQRHNDYDYGEALMSVGAELVWLFLRLSPDAQVAVRRVLDIEDTVPPYLIGSALIRQAEDVAARLGAEPPLIEVITRYRPLMLFMQEFLDSLRANPRKDTPFDEAELHRLLVDAGVVAPAPEPGLFRG